MKNIFVILIAVSLIGLVGCSRSPDEPKVFSIDGCEYIKQRTYGYNIYIHKGNCKYCIERMKQIVADEIRSNQLEKGETITVTNYVAITNTYVKLVN